jgi:aminoglycoside phosphotransferase (APT) family kinase protein
MPIQPKPPAEVAIDVALVGRLLAEQHPDLADLPIVPIAEGWDNALFRLGDDLLVRIPRRAASAPLIAHEQRWLPVLAHQLPLPIPAPVRTGVPGREFPWPWTITRWFAGDTAIDAPECISAAVARALGEFLRALHQPAPAAAPRNPWRGVPLGDRTARLHQHLDDLDASVNVPAVLALWERALGASPWTTPPLWVHGDLHAGNLLVDERGLVAILDFADLTSGDPAVDLSVMWTLLPPSLRSTFAAAASGGAYVVDAAMVMRARGWALVFGLALLANSADDPRMSALGRTAIDAVLNGDM